VKKLFIMGVALVASLALASSVLAYSNPAAYTGQGLNSNPDGFGGYDLNTEICGVENGADADGPYLLFIMNATGAKNADITFSGAAATGADAGTHAMTKSGGGAFKYIAEWHDPNTLPGNVSGTYDGKAKNVQLVVSHGCRPFENKGAWCSPGFWKNAEDAAWALTGRTKAELFNETVVPSFYDTPNADLALTIGTVLTTSTGQGGANKYGPESDPFGLNAYNATGAFVTDNIPGYDYSDEARLLNNESATCPIDHHGVFKNVEPVL
jgi:hypothetical protein